MKFSPDTKQRDKSVKLSEVGGEVDKEQTAEKRVIGFLVETQI